MFHPARVIEVFSPANKSIDSSDGRTQVMLDMWDENLFTFEVHPDIASKVKVDDIVLVDYSPMSAGSPVPKRIVTKILKGNTAKHTWNRYKDFLEKNKSSQKNVKVQNAPEQVKQVDDHSYMG